MSSAHSMNARKCAHAQKLTPARQSCMNQARSEEEEKERKRDMKDRGQEADGKKGSPTKQNQEREIVSKGPKLESQRFFVTLYDICQFPPWHKILELKNNLCNCLSTMPEHNRQQGMELQQQRHFSMVLGTDRIAEADKKESLKPTKKTNLTDCQPNVVVG